MPRHESPPAPLVRIRPGFLLPALAVLGAACGGSTDSGGQGGGQCVVVEREELGAGWKCGEPEGCISDYVSYLESAKAYARPITRTELLEGIWEVESGRVEVLPGPLPGDALRDALIDILNLGHLLEGIDERPLTVTTIRKDETPEYDERELLFEDPLVGTFEGILLSPPGPGPFPAVVAIHGHRDKAEVYRDRFHGNEYPAHGYAILMLTMRAMGIDRPEHEISREFLESGFALLGVRTYETLLGLKYIECLPNVAADRIGLIGHSGGSSASNVTVRLRPAGLRAYVSDLAVDYSEWGTLLEPYHCETIPKLYPYHDLIADFATSEVPVKAVPYGYTNGMGEIFQFFDEQLKGSASRNDGATSPRRG